MIHDKITQENVNTDCFTCAEFYYNDLIMTLKETQQLFTELKQNPNPIEIQFSLDLFMKIINEKSYNHTKICCSDATFEEQYPQIFVKDDRDIEKRRIVEDEQVKRYFRGLVLEGLVFYALQTRSKK